MRINAQALYQQENFLTNIGCYLGYLYKKKKFLRNNKIFFFFAWTALGHFYKKKSSPNYKKISSKL